MDIMTHRTRQSPYRTVVVVSETPSHVSFRQADTITLPRDMFDEAYVAVRERPFIPREELEAIVDRIDEFADMNKDDAVRGRDIGGAMYVRDFLTAVLGKVTK